MFAPDPTAIHQAGSLQNADVLRHRVERHGKGPGKLRDAQFCPHHALEYCPTHRMSQRREGAIEVLLLFIQLHGVMIIGWSTAVKEPGQTLLSRPPCPQVAEPQRKLDEGVTTQDEGATQKQPARDRIVPHDDRQGGGEDGL